MPGRRVAPPRNVTVASLADTGDAATDRVMIQAEQNLQDLQERAREAAKTTAAHGATLSTLTARTMAFNVKDHGALGDGLADDAPAINAAIGAAAAASSGQAAGGFVEFPPGTYLIRSALILKSKVGLRGAGSPATIIKLADSFNDTSAVRNEHQDGTQEFAFLDGLQIEGNKAGGAVVSEALVSWGSLFINSFIRDVIISDSSSVGLHVFAAGSPGGMGPLLIENVWVLHSGSHNVLIEEKAGNSGAAAGIVCINLTSEHQASNSSALYLKGLGNAGQWNFWNTHIEMGGSETNRTGITFDGVFHVLFDGVQLLAGTAANVIDGITILNVVQNVGIQIRGVTNINLIDPVLRDLKNGVTYGSGNLAWYVTADVVAPPALNFFPISASGFSAVFQNHLGTPTLWVTADGQVTGSSVNLAGLDVAGAGAGPAGDDRAQAWTANGGGNVFGLVYPSGGGGLLRMSYLTGAKNIFDLGTDGSFRHISNKLGFFAAAVTTQPTITGSRGGNAALASLLTAGATLGLWIDGTTP